MQNFLVHPPVLCSMFRYFRRPLTIAILLGFVGLTGCDGPKRPPESSPLTRQPSPSPLSSSSPSPSPSPRRSPLPPLPAPGNILTLPDDTLPRTNPAPLAPLQPIDSPQPSPPTAEASPQPDKTPPQKPDVGGLPSFTNVRYQQAETTPDGALVAAIRQVMPGVDEGGTRYFYNRIDLNGDGALEAIALLSGSYTCGTGGCTTLVFEMRDDVYQLVSRITLVNAPVIVSSTQTDGWHDLIVRVTGGGTAERYTQLKFDGSSYPRNPSVAPDVPAGAVVSGTVVINDDTAANGLPLTP